MCCKFLFIDFSPEEHILCRWIFPFRLHVVEEEERGTREIATHEFKCAPCVVPVNYEITCYEAIITHKTPSGTPGLHLLFIILP